MKMKRCTKCGEEKILDAFEVHKGRTDDRGSRCKACRNKSYKREYAWKYVEANREKERERSRIKVKGKKTVRDPFRQAARSALRNAVTAGMIAKPSTCSQCQAIGNIHGHHHDYSKPFDVEWLCSICHGKAHRKHALRETGA